MSHFTAAIELAHRTTETAAATGCAPSDATWTAFFLALTMAILAAAAAVFRQIAPKSDARWPGLHDLLEITIRVLIVGTYGLGLAAVAGVLAGWT